MKNQKVLLAGATGHLGSFLTHELVAAGFDTKIVVRNVSKVELKAPNLKVIEAEITKPETIIDICKNIDVVITTIGITRQKDGLTYMDVDYRANVNLINEAVKNNVKKFIYISVLNGEKLKFLKICQAKEKLVGFLKNSGLQYCIIRPNGFFSDMKAFLKMAESGNIYLFGSGKYKLNPIHSKDLAKFIVNNIDNNINEVEIGGPEILSQNEIGNLALSSHNKSKGIIHLPNWLRKFILWILYTFTSSKFYGPYEFFLTTMVMDMIAPKYGSITLKDFFNEEVKKNNSPNKII